MKACSNNPVIVRANESGVWFGYMDIARSLPGCILLTDARRVWEWSGANSCSGLANTGPTGGKICAPVVAVMVFNPCEVIDCRPEAVEAFGKVPTW